MATSLDLATLLRPVRKSPPQTAIPSVVEGEIREKVANASLNERCEILRFGTVEDISGGVSEAWTQAGSYSCRVEFNGDGSEQSSETTGITNTAPYTVYLPKSAQILADDRLGIPGWFNVFSGEKTYSLGAKVILEPFDGFYYECRVNASHDSASPSTSRNWRKVERAQFLQIKSVLDAVGDADLIAVLAEVVT